jgi:hypothetical protein
MDVSPSNPIPVGYGGTSVCAFNQSANTPITATLPAVAGMTNYVTKVMASATGATAAQATNIGISGLINGASISQMIGIPAGVSNAVSLDINFDPPIPAYAANTAITLTLPAAGAGNTLQTVSIFGFYK